jgi:hypothetical protein
MAQEAHDRRDNEKIDSGRQADRERSAWAQSTRFQETNQIVNEEKGRHRYSTAIMMTDLLGCDHGGVRFSTIKP